MKSKNPGTLVLFALMALCTSCQSGTRGLYHDEARMKPEDGTDCMVFDEVARNEKDSIVEVDLHTRGACTKGLFVTRGCYEIAKIRRSPYFIVLRDWEGPDDKVLYRIGFSPDDKVDPKAYFGGEIDEDGDLKFMSVKDCDELWGGRVHHPVDTRPRRR
jgi:hypothetical protein